MSVVIAGRDASTLSEPPAHTQRGVGVSSDEMIVASGLRSAPVDDWPRGSRS